MERNKLFWFLVIVSAITGAYFNVGYYHPDEHYQILEFAGYLSGIVTPESLPWEFHHQMRPSLQPIIAYIVHQFSLLIVGEHNPVLWTFLLRLLSAVFSIFTTYQFVKSFEKELKEDYQKWFWLFSFFSWFTVFLHVRFSSEAWAENFWLLGIVFLLKKNKTFQNTFWAGIFLGLSFVFRYQLAFAILGILTWIVYFDSSKWKKLLSIALGGGTILLFSILLDSWFYGNWVIAPYHYFYQNLILKKVTYFGTEPWYYYFVQIFISKTMIINLFYLVTFFFFLFYYPKHLLTWTIIPFLIIHFIITHKELRFLYPLWGFLPFMLMKFFEYIKLDKIPYYKIFLYVLFSIHIPPLLVTLIQYNSMNILVYEIIWKNYDEKEPTIIFIKENIHDLPCKVINNREAQSQCLLPRIYLNNTGIISSYYCEGDSIVLDENKYKRMFIIYYDFKDKKNIPKQYKRVYSFYPEWLITYFNFGGWVNRTSFLEIYEYSPRRN